MASVASAVSRMQMIRSVVGGRPVSALGRLWVSGARASVSTAGLVRQPSVRAFSSGAGDASGGGGNGAAGEGSLFDILDSDGEEELEWGEFEDDDLEAAGRGVDNALSGDSAQLGDDLLFSEEGKVEFPDYTVQEQRRLIELADANPSYFNGLWEREADWDVQEMLGTAKDPDAVFRVENRQFFASEDEEKANGQRLGPGVGYCVCCYHGEDLLDATNTKLLSLFVTERGAILPKRFTNMCAKHQRKLARTIKHARHMNLMPHTKRLHPKLRATSLTPDPMTEDPATADLAREEHFLTEALKEVNALGGK